MGRWPRKSCRWPTVLAEVILLQGLLISGNHATDTSTATGTTVHAAPTADSFNAASLGGTDLYLDVTLNGADGGLVHFGYIKDNLWTSSASLRKLGFELPSDMANPVRLNTLQGVQAAYDEARQTVTISAPLGMLRLDTTVLNAPENTRLEATASPGLLLNYDIYGTSGTHGNSSLSAFTELRAFNGNGVFSSTELLQATRSTNLGWQTRPVRLDTSWSTSFPDTLLTLRIGDTLTDALSWSRSTRIAGIQLGTNFALQPYMVTAPLPAFLGSATLPSHVQLYVNGVQQYSGNVPAGPFQLNTTPNISGAGKAHVVLTDTLGRATSLDFSLYDERQMMQQGLSDWSAELGVVRKNYGLNSLDYGHDPVGSGTWRYGASHRLTIDAHAEAISGLINAGGGGALLLGSAGGVVSASLTRSEHVGEAGSLYALGYSWRNDHFNFSASGFHTRGEYSDVETLYGAPPPRISAQAVAGYSTARMGGFGVSYVHLRYPRQDATRYASAFWSLSVRRALSLNLNFNQNLDRSADRTVFLVTTLALDGNFTVTSNVQRDGNRTGFALTSSEAPHSEGGLSWRAAARQGDSQNGGQGELDYLGRHGQLDLGISATGDIRYAYAGATGALVFMGGDVFAARHINDGFAVVSTDGIAAVPVSLENNLIGTTNRLGLLLVSPLNAYQSNQLSIDPMEFPADVRVERVRVRVAPTDRAGTLVRFRIMKIRAASVKLHNADGQPLPVGSHVTVAGQADDGAMIGFDGIVYLETLTKHNTLIVSTPLGNCRASFDYHNDNKSVPAIGPLLCRKETTP